MSSVTSTASGGSGGSSAADGRNVWDAATALIVVGALVFLVVFLSKHYTTLNDVTTVLGIAAPVLAAAFGVSLGYWSGEKKGQAAGKTNGQKQVASQLVPIANSLERHLGVGIIDPVTKGFESAAGTTSFAMRPASGEPVVIETANISRTQQAVSDLKGIIAANR
jgi:hypothetical protein